jgi:5'-3' exonuclease
LKWELGWVAGQSHETLARRIDDWVFLCFFVGEWLLFQLLRKLVDFYLMKITPTSFA